MTITALMSLVDEVADCARKATAALLNDKDLARVDELEGRIKDIKAEIVAAGNTEGGNLR